MNPIILALVFFSSLAAQALDSKTKALHVLNRFAYGPKLAEVEMLSRQGDKGLKDWFEAQLHPDDHPQLNLQKKLESLKSLTYTNEQMIKFYPKINEKNKMKIAMDVVEGGPKDILKELVLQKITRAAESENQFEEVLLDFWFNHFNVNFDKGAVRFEITSFERDVLRPHLFGKFKDLLLATAKSPAMLFYLDNHRSRKSQINENYARELLELHTLGVDGGYTQKDIQETARVLTGWGIEKPNQISNFKFFKKQHDEGDKKVLDLEFNKNEGEKEGDKLIEYLAHQKSTAQFIAKKLAVKFISDTPSQKSIDKLAEVFIKTDGNLKEVYRAIYASDEFWKSENMASKIKTPFEYLISSIRATGSQVLVDATKINALKGFFDQSGQALYRCQPPTGYKAISEYWVTPGAMVNRINLALRLAKNQIPQVDFEKEKLTQDIAANKYRAQIDIITYLNRQVFNGVIKAETLQKLDSLVDQTKLYQEESKKDLSLHYFPVDKLVGLMLSTPEFQRR